MNAYDEDEHYVPADHDAERAVLGAMLLDARCIGDVAAVAPPHAFHLPAHERIAEALVALDVEGLPTDPVSIHDHFLKRGQHTLVGGAPYLGQLVAAACAIGSATYEAHIVRRWHEKRALGAIGTRLVQMRDDPTVDLDDIPDLYAAAIKELDAGLAETPGTDIPTMGDLFDATIDGIEHPAPNRFIPTGIRDLDNLVGGWSPGEFIIIAARPAIGKALALDTPIATPDGWTTMGDVQVGDRVFDAEGLPTTVVAATEIMTGRPCYEVEFSDGSVIVADEEHQWLTETRAARRANTPPAGWTANRSSPSSRDQRWKREYAATVTTGEILQALYTKTAVPRANHTVANAKPLQLPDARLPIAPYTLGAWLGDGTSRTAQFTSADEEILNRIRVDGYDVLRPPRPSKFHHRISNDPDLRRRLGQAQELFEAGYAVSRIAAHVGLGEERIRAHTGGHRTNRGMRRNNIIPGPANTAYETFQERLRTVGVLGNKHIPDQYLRASEQQRRDLLAGLLDTDGYINKTGTTILGLTNRRLAEGAFELVASLGYRPNWSAKQVKGARPETSTFYLITFTTCDKVFYLGRKALRTPTSVSGSRATKRPIIDVRPIASVPVRCIQVDNPGHMYLAGRAMIPTHNSTLARGFAREATIRHGVPTLFVSLEMSSDENMRCIIAAEAKVGLHRINRNNLTEDDWGRIARKQPSIVAAPLHIDEGADVTLGLLRHAAHDIRRKRGLGLIVIDYLQLMTAPKAENRQQAVSSLSRGLKLLAKDLGVPIIALSQLNRNAEARADKRPAMSDLRESGSLEQDADVVILMHREDAYVSDSPRAGECDLIVEKNRTGPTATITAAFQGHYARVADMAGEAWSPHAALNSAA